MEIHIPTDGVTLPGILAVPEDAKGIVLFVHGSGSSRFSPRNTFVALALQKSAIATLLIDLLTETEDEVYQTRFDIDLLSRRLSHIIRWLVQDPKTKHLPIGLFGASTGAAAALIAAASGEPVAAVVSRGGRPDLAKNDLNKVMAPTLFIVGGNDVGVIEQNEQAFSMLQCEKKLEIVPGASHLFEEPGTLERVSELATEWFLRFLPARGAVGTSPTEGPREAEELVTSDFRDNALTPTEPPGKVRAASKEGYRHFHRK